jgi:nitrogen regulatory protein PII
MKLITAIIKPERLADVIEFITDSGATGVTVSEVRGFGQQYGQLANVWVAAGVDDGQPAPLLPKIRLDIVVPAGQAERVADAIAKRANTGTIGDGKIWITPVDTVLRVRTGERDRAALCEPVCDTDDVASSARHRDLRP